MSNNPFFDLDDFSVSAPAVPAAPTDAVEPAPAVEPTPEPVVEAVADEPAPVEPPAVVEPTVDRAPVNHSGLVVPDVAAAMLAGLFDEDPVDPGVEPVPEPVAVPEPLAAPVSEPEPEPERVVPYAGTPEPEIPVVEAVAEPVAEQPAPVIEAVATVAEAVAIATEGRAATRLRHDDPSDRRGSEAVEPKPAREPRSHRPLWIGLGVVVVLALGGVAWWTLSNKESAPAAPVAVKSAPVAEPARVVATPTIEPAVVEAPAAPADVVGDLVGAVVAEPEPTKTVTPEPKPTAPVVEPAKPAVEQPRPVAKPKPAVAKPKPPAKKPEPQWQDEALDQLDDLEKRL